MNDVSPLTTRIVRAKAETTEFIHANDGPICWKIALDHYGVQLQAFWFREHSSMNPLPMDGQTVLVRLSEMPNLPDPVLIIEELYPLGLRPSI